METHITADINDNEWRGIADLISNAIPNALVSKFGNRFTVKFYSKIVRQPYSCGYVAKDESGNTLGVIIGSVDSPRAHSIALKGQLPKLIMVANFRLFSYPVINWVLKGVWARIIGPKSERTNTPNAELVAIAVTPEVRGTGLAQKLLRKMEEFMVTKELDGPYKILTEKANKRANQFYEKIGAALVRTDLHHGRKINEWHKIPTVSMKNE